MEKGFHFLDYIVFLAAIAISVGIGIWFSRPTKNKTTDAYLTGDRQLRLLPVIISLCVTFVSAITMIGTGSEVYLYGIQFICFILSQVLGTVFAAITWVPLIYPLKLTSINQYLKMRYRSHVAPIVGMVLQLLLMIMLSGVVLYAPATLFESMGGFPPWASLLLVGFSSTLYTSIGGMKGVIVTDVFQAVIMMIGLISVITMGFIKVGGLSSAWKVMEEWERVNFDNFFVPNPWKRYDFWSLVPLQAIMWTITYGLMQASVQRYSSLPSKKFAICSVLGVIPGNIMFMMLSCLTGVVMFAYFVQVGCDPLTGEQIDDINQLMLYLVKQILYYPGVPGLFLATIFCSSLSSISSFLTAIAAFTWDDFLKFRLAHLSDSKKTIILKVLVAIFGMLGTGIGFLCLKMEGTLITMVLLFTQGLFVPLGVLFISAASIPKLNLKGSLLASSIVGVFIGWLIVGSQIYKVEAPEPLRLPEKMCPNKLVNETVRISLGQNQNLSISQNISGLKTGYGMHVHDTSTATPTSDPEDFWDGGILVLYRISHYWFGPIGFIFGILLSIIFSFIPCFQEKVLIPERLIFSFMRCYFTLASEDEEDEVDVKEKMLKMDIKSSDEKKTEPLINNNQKWMYESPQRARMTSTS